MTHFTEKHLLDYLDVCIAKARTNEQLFYSDLQGLYDLSSFLDYIFGKDVLDDLSKIINTCKKNFLITLDGFDTSFDDFRRESLTKNLDLEKRAKFEVDWLRALLLLVINIRNNTNPENRLYDLMEFCITVPKDRFYEVKTTERDNYRYHNRHSAVDWSGIELAQLLRKRLEELSQDFTSKEMKIHERLNIALSKHYAHIPKDITVPFNGNQYLMPLFMYVLRHTCWRPREILLYYATILAVSEDLRRRGRKITTETIRRIIKEKTLDILETEFFSEFESIVNIRDIINSFTKSTQYVGYSQRLNSRFWEMS